MKKLYLSLLGAAALLFFIPSNARAQHGFEPQVKVGYDIGIDDYKNKSFGLELLGGYRFNGYLRVGVGVGISWCEPIMGSGDYKETAAYIPVFGNIKGNFIKEGISPYLSLDLGYSNFLSFSDYAKNYKMGFFCKPAFGVDFPLQKRVGLFVEIGYKYQKQGIKGVPSSYLDGFDNFSQLSIAIGCKF